MEGSLWLRAGLYGWKVTDCKICFEYGLYYNPVKTPRRLSAAFPPSYWAGFKKSRDRTNEPYLHFEIYAPECLWAYHDAQRYCADIL